MSIEVGKFDLKVLKYGVQRVAILTSNDHQGHSKMYVK